jgi:hypothetical protein
LWNRIRTRGIFWNKNTCFSDQLVEHIHQNNYGKLSFFLGGGGQQCLVASPPPRPSIFSIILFLSTTLSMGWPASPCTCNGLWLHSCMAVVSKKTFFLLVDQTPCPYMARSLPAQLSNTLFYKTTLH